jgi:hypothetical protein
VLGDPPRRRPDRSTDILSAVYCLLAVLSNLEAPPGPLAGAPELPVADFSLCCLAAVVSIFRPGVVAGDRGDPDRRS